MRERKYRAWDKKRKEMLSAGDYPQDEEVMNLMDIDWEGLGILFDGDIIACDECGRFVYLANDRYILMQYTGLKDKNGKEIYEGDIVAVKPVFVGSSIGLIEWSEECACFFFNNGTNWGLIKVSTWPFKMEIIGNIYENPDLLEGK